MNIVSQYFDKVLLFLMFVGVLAVSIYDQHIGDMTGAAWAHEQANTIGGAVIGLVTGYAIAQHKQNQAEKKGPDA